MMLMDDFDDDVKLEDDGPSVMVLRIMNVATEKPHTYRAKISKETPNRSAMADT